jgi:ubiquinone/menaquinone biosynthesis C-methylase UbiE
MSSPPLTPLAAAALHAGRPERILQVQCGAGDGALFLAREFPAARVRGVDRSERAVREATARVGLDPEGRVAFKLGGPRRLPFPDDHFDLVAALDQPVAVGEVARVLRPGGRLILAYSRRARAPRGPRAALLRRRLARRRLEPVEAGEAGDGSFSVARLLEPGRPPRAD